MLTHIEDLSTSVGEDRDYYFIINKNSMVFSVMGENGTESKLLKKYLKENLSDVFNLSFTWTNALLTLNTKKKHPSPEELEFYAIQIIDFFISESIHQVCQISLEPEDIKIYRINNDVLILSHEVYLEEKVNAENFYDRSGNRLNTYLKIVGVAILLGLGWFLVSQMGYIVYLISVAMVAASYHIFEKNSGRPTKTDSFFIFLINFCAITLSEYLSMAYKFYKVFDKQISFSKILSTVMPYAFTDSEILWSYIANVGIGALALIIVAFYFAKSAAKDQNIMYVAYPIIVDNYQG